MTSVYALAVLEVLPSTHEDIKQRLERANYDHAIDPKSGRIDMTGIAILPNSPPHEVVISVRNELVTPEAIERMRAARESSQCETDLFVEPHTTLKSYRHYKGGTYTLLLIGRNSEARDELFAVYVSHETQQVWIRPWAMFTELVRWPDDVIRPRFCEWTP